MLNECVKSKVKRGGGSIQVCGCFSYNDVGDLYRINNILTKESTTPSFKDMLYHLALNYVVTDSFYKIMTPNTPLNSIENICRGKKTMVCWLLWIFLLNPLILIQLNIYANI